MNFKKLNNIIGWVLFAISSIVYLYTMQPTLSFWDCGEFVASAYTLSVPHPPGAPLWILLGKVATMLPIGSNPAVKMNALSAISSGFTVMFLYLIIVMVIRNWRSEIKNTWDAVIVYGSAAIGSLSYAFSDSFWFNATESEVYSLGTMLIALCVWLLMIWRERSNQPGNEKYILLFSFVVGLSLGIHLLVVQVILVGGLIYYFKKYNYERKSFIITFLISCGLFLLVYPIVVIWYPGWLAGDIKTFNIKGSKFIEIIAFLAFPALIYAAYRAYQKNKRNLALFFSSLFLVILGYSLYTGVLLRANVDNLPINENAPKNLETLVKYLSREQYGDAPHWPRRHSQEPMHRRTWANYTTDFDFLWRYQINHMFNRYLGWQYIGRAGHDQDKGIDWSKFYGIPFLIGLFGLFYHFRKDWKLGLTFLWMFLLMGIISTLFQRQQDPQPRERDYFYTGAFFVYSLWIGLGMMGILEILKDYIKNSSSLKAAGVVVLLAGFVLVPVNMFRVNYFQENRHNNYVPFDYAYNILQSAPKDAIMFTNGDNDTFPLWYLQSVGYRQDVRVVNLSLLNTDWYIKEMKNTMPYGALKVPINLSDAQIDKLQPTQWGDYKIVSINIPPEAYPDSMRTKGNTPDKLTWRMPATINFQNIKAVQVKDLMMLEIIKSNNWQRPIYWSATVTEDNFLGLDEYLIIEGMSRRLVPYKDEQAGDLRVDRKLMLEQFTITPEQHSKTPQIGFFFRGLNDPNIFFEQTTTNAVQNYRSQYLLLAHAYLNDSNFTKVSEVLAKMEENLPGNVVPYDYRIEYDVALLYARIGNIPKFEEFAKNVEEKALQDLQRNPTDIQSYYNPYRLLLDIYEIRGDDKSTLDLLMRIDKITPNSPEVKMKIELLKQKLNK